MEMEKVVRFLEEGIKKIETKFFLRGIEEGKLEEILNIAEQMMKLNYHIEEIVKITNLSEEEIKGLNV